MLSESFYPFSTRMGLWEEIPCFANYGGNVSYIHEMLLPNPSPYSPALSYTLLYIVIIQAGEGGEGLGNEVPCIQGSVTRQELFGKDAELFQKAEEVFQKALQRFDKDILADLTIRLAERTKTL